MKAAANCGMPGGSLRDPSSSADLWLAPAPLTRRALLVRSGAAALSLAAAVPLLDACAPASAGPARQDFVAYHDQTAAYHQGQVAALTGRGYRLISLSVYDDRADRRAPLDLAALRLRQLGHGVRG